MRGMTHMPTGWPSAADPYGFGAPRPPVEPLSPQDRPPTVTRNDALAAMEASAELGPGLRRDVVDAFVADVNARMAADWQQREYRRQQDEQRGTAERRARTRDLVICLSFAIPLTGIAADAGGLLGVLISWAGIVLVAGAAGLRRGGRSDGRRELGR